MSVMGFAHRARPKMRSAAALLGISLSVAACGGSSHRPDSAARARYDARANAICGAARSQTSPLINKIVAAEPALVSGATGAAQRVAPTVTQLHNIATASLAQLTAIPQPAGDHAAIESFLAPLGRLVGGIGQAAGALAHGQSAQAFALIQQAQPDAQQVRSAAAAYGLNQCGSVVSILG